MGNQSPYPYDPQNPYGEQAPGESQPSESPGGQAGASEDNPPAFDQGDQGAQGNQGDLEAYPPYAPESSPPAPPSYGQPAYSPPQYEAPPQYQPPTYEQRAYGPSDAHGYGQTSEQGYPPVGNSPPSQPESAPQPPPYTGPYSQPYAQPGSQPYGAPYAGQPYAQPGAEPYPPYQPGYPQPGYPQPGQYQGPYAAPYGAPYGAYGGAIPRQDSRAGLAIAALVLGIISLIFSCANVCDTPFIVLGLIFGTMGLQSTTRRQMAVWGLVLSGIALVIALVVFVMWIGTRRFGFSPAGYP